MHTPMTALPVALETTQNLGPLPRLIKRAICIMSRRFPSLRHFVSPVVRSRRTLCITSRRLVQESLSYCPLTACAFLFPLRLKIPTLIRADLFLAISLRLLASLSCL